MRKSLEKQQAKLASRGISIGIDELKQNNKVKKYVNSSCGKKKLNFSIDSILDHIQMGNNKQSNSSNHIIIKSKT